ncbi:MAG: hypothetical protein COU10_03545 [Candidatus Harrisonbacteria bacterium CG10_big_fil_rev_8_21_14_0_10_45_28]|uniref:Methyltransferase type 11 domain-containing protein n=1 Tax=Candidatus Harrisonbacteria bacterium CG10_big_fil_rev_8_21_14_0_10_45_28 TaxID=1974586 RepID=A0A2H0UMK5_9BACT|nr:MAG: hypothetical protein COU10_03545 [Candidatus Harrisonbacteria bacterium CG10_big_fil_rev_8_21_14_0_10_45_28]
MKWTHWPTLQNELGEKGLALKGKILNAGSGTRKIKLPNATKIVNCDLQPLLGVDVVCDLDKLPFDNAFFDGILSVAVLEHCRHPWMATEEMSRVLKKKGVLICAVPFFQPIHNIPSDYFRFTPAGLVSILEEAGFYVENIEFTHSIFHTLGWLGEDATNDKIIWKILFSPLALIIYGLSFLCRQRNIKTAPNVITVVAHKK